MHVRNQILRGHALVVALLVVVTAGGILASHYARLEFEDVARQTVPELEALQTLRHSGLRIVASTMEYAFLVHLQREAAGEPPTSAGDRDAPAHELALIDRARTDYANAIGRFRSLRRTFHPDEPPAVDEILAAGSVLMTAGERLVQTVRIAASAPATLAAKERFERAEQDYLRVIDSYLGHVEHALVEHTSHVRDAIRAAIATLGALGLAAILATVWLARRTAVRAGS